MASFKDAQDALAEFEDAYAKWEKILDAGTPFATQRQWIEMLTQLDAAALTLDRLHDANQQANGGTATIPTRAEFEANLSDERRDERRDLLGRARGGVEGAVDELGRIVTDGQFLTEFDALHPVERLGFVRALLEQAERIMEIEADKTGADVMGAGLSLNNRSHPAILAQIGDQHVLSPARLEALARDTPIEVVWDEQRGHDVRLSPAQGETVESLISRVRGDSAQPGTSATTFAWTLAGQYGNFVTMAAAALSAAEARDRADRALVAAYDKFGAMLAPKDTPEAIKQSLEQRKASLTQIDRDFFLRIQTPLGILLGSVDIYLALKSFAADPTADSALQDAMTAILKAADLINNSVDSVRSAAGEATTKLAMRLAGAAIIIGLFILDLRAAQAGFDRAARYGDYSVAVGQLLKGASATLFTIAGLGAVLAGSVVVSGPFFWVVVLAVALALIGEALVIWTQDTDLENFAAVCAFGINPSTSTDPGLIEYRFMVGSGPRLAAQLERLRTLLNPLGFKVEAAPGSHTLTHRRPLASGPAALRLPAGSSVAVNLIASDGSSTPWQSQGTVAFDLNRFRNDGVSQESSFLARGLTGRWLEMEVVVAASGDTLREFAKIENPT